MNRRDFFGSGAALLSAGAPSALLADTRSRADAAGTDQRRLSFDSVAAMTAAAGLREGDLCACPKALYQIVAANTLSANGGTVLDLNGADGQAVLHAHEPLADMAALLEDTRPQSWFPDAAIVRTEAENFAFETAQADVSDRPVNNAGGAAFRIIDRPMIEFAAFGGAFGNTGEQNARALLGAMNALKSKGGRILFGSGVYKFAPAVYPATSANVWLTGNGMRATQFVPSVHGGETREWMMVFGEDDVTSYLGFSGIDVAAPTGREQARFNGIRICSTNQMIIRDCQGRFVNGTAWQLERAHNSKIDIRTVRCGSSEDGAHSVLISGTLGNFADQEDAVFNDMVILGMTEQDYLGWKIENGLVIRPESSIKVHGSSDSTRSLHLHRINNGAMSIYPTLGFDSDAFVVISDAESAETQTIPVQNASQPTRFNLNIICNHNIRYFGEKSGSLVAVDCAAPNSRVILSGDILRHVQRENGEFRYVRLAAPGHALAEIDLSELKFQDGDSSKWVEDNRTASGKTISRRATGMHLPAVAGFVGSDASMKLIGQTDHILANGDPNGGAAPRMSLIGLTDDNGPEGTLLYSAMQPLMASIEGATVARTMIASQRLNIPLHGGKAATAVLRRLTVGAGGVGGSHDPANFWKVRLYIAGSATDLVLCRDRPSASPGDGLPSKVLEGWSVESHGFDFHQGIGPFAVTRDQTITVRLEPVGQPPALSDVTATAYFEMRA